MKRFLIVVLSLTAVISLIISVSNIIFRLERRDRIVTTAEITFIGKTVRIMYDPSTADSEGAYTTTNENGETITEYRFIETESYDIWLQDSIAAGIIFLVSALSAAVCIFRYKKTKA